MLLKNALSEGGEEAATDLVNWTAEAIYDVIASQDQSEWKRMVAAYMEQGYTENEAAGMAIGDRAKQLGLDVAGGAISGGIMGGGGAAINSMGNAINNSRTGNSFIKQNGQSGVGALAAQGLGLNQNTAAYKQAQKIQAKLDAGKSASNYSVGKLLSSMSEAERALGDFSNDVYMDMYLAGDEDLAKMTYGDLSKRRTAIPEGFDERDFEMLRRQVAAAKAPQYGESLSVEDLQAYIDSGEYGTEKLNNDYYRLYGKNMPGYFGEDYEYDYERISELAESKDGHGILKYVDSVIATAQTEEEAEAMIDVLYDMVAHFGYDLDELERTDKLHNGNGIAGR